MPHIHHYHHHFHLFSILRKKELSELYIMAIIRTFAFALIGVFVPAYLLDLGYSLDALILYYLYFGIVYGFLNLVTVKFISKIGVKRSILLGVPFLICYLLLLNSLPTYNWSLYLIASIAAIYSALYWPAFHIYFFRSSDKKHRGEEYGVYEVVQRIPMIVAPLLGALIIAFFGFQVLFYIACVIFLVSPLPLFFSKEIYEPFSFSFKHMITQHNIKDVAVFFFEGFTHNAEFLLWPIFIFVTLKSFLSLGTIASFGLLGATLVTYIFGRMSDIMDKRRIIKTSSIFMLILWILSSFANKFIHFAILSPIKGIFFTLFSIPYMALFYDKSTKHTAEFIIFREFTMHVFGCSMLLLIFYFTKSFLITFLITGISTFGFWLF